MGGSGRPEPLSRPRSGQADQHAGSGAAAGRDDFSLSPTTTTSATSRMPSLITAVGWDRPGAAAGYVLQAEREVGGPADTQPVQHQARHGPENPENRHTLTREPDSLATTSSAPGTIVMPNRSTTAR